MQPNKPQNQNNIPNHVPISQLNEQLANKDRLATLKKNAPVNNNQPVIISPNTNNAPQSPSAIDSTLPGELVSSIETTAPSTDITNQPAKPNAILPTKPSINTKPAIKAPIKLLVVVQFVSLLVIVFGFYPSPLFTVFSLMISGVIIIALGLFLGIWSFMSFHQKINISPVPLKHSFLVTGGPFKYIRHPMYATLLLISVGLLLVYPSITRILAVIALVLVLNIKMNIEERLLAERYHHYGRYQRLTGKLLPKLHKPKIDIDIDLPKF
jgi:protein-S-isoprenylcysteine O-methyltransferase Ste14